MAWGAIERGDSVYLRRPVAADRDEFTEAVRRSRALHRPWVEPPADRPAFDQYLARGRRRNKAHFLVCRNEDGVIVGVVNIDEIVRGHLQSAFLGYYAFAPFERHGYLREGLWLMLRHAFGPQALHRVEANVQPDNAASIALVESLGFRREGYSPRYLKIGGRWRDHVRYSILAEEFRRAERQRHQPRSSR